MTNGLTSPKPTDRPPGPAPDSARGAPPPSDAFAGMLDAQQARTATAEGQSPEKPDAATPTPTPDAAVAAAVLAVPPVPPTMAGTPVGAVAAPTVEVETAPAAQAVSVAEVAPEVAGSSVPVPAMPEARVAAPIQAPVAQQAATPSQSKPETQPTSGPATAQPVVATTAPQPTPQQSQHEQPQPRSQPQQSVPVAPAEAARPAPPLPSATPVPLARAAEAVEHVLRMATSRGGVTHARIALHPAELGSVDVHIRSTAEGLVARVVAHTAEAVQTLQHAADDLRQSLEEQGLNLMSLDIGQPGERDAERAAAQAGRRASGVDDAAASDDAEETSTETLRLPSGVLVDVLA